MLMEEEFYKNPNEWLLKKLIDEKKECERLLRFYMDNNCKEESIKHWREEVDRRGKMIVDYKGKM